MPRKVAIVAKGGTSALAPFRDESWEIWGMPWISYPRVTRLFEVHEEGALSPEFDADWRAKAFPRYDGVPLYAVRSRLHISPSTVELDVAALLSLAPVPYFENSIAYMLAQAVLEQVDVIGLWGVHMRGIREYEAERPSVTYLIGLAQGRGIEVYISAGCPLFASVWEAGRYGVDAKRRASPQ